MSSAAQHLLKTFPFKMFRATQCLLKPLPVANGYLISLPANFTTKTPLPYLSTPFKLHLSWSLSSLSPPPCSSKTRPFLHLELPLMARPQTLLDQVRTTQWSSKKKSSLGRIKRFPDPIPTFPIGNPMAIVMVGMLMILRILNLHNFSYDN